MNSLRIFEYTLSQAERGLCPFAEEYNEDDWVIFHGTSNHAEKDIEEKGFVWQDESYSKMDIERLTEIFEGLHWMGETTAGFGVLASFTKNDFLRGSGEKKPVYFAETSQRALGYACSDDAGGETARAVRYAFADLEKYLTCEEFRTKAIRETGDRLRDMYQGEVPDECEPRGGQQVDINHVRALWKYYERRGFRIPFANSYNVEPVDYTEEWLREKLDQLRHLRQRCENILTAFQYGLVYAVRMLPTDVPYLTYSSWAGLAARIEIPPVRIVAKAIIPRGFQYEIREDPLRGVRDEGGVFAAVKGYQADKARATNEAR